MPKPIKTIADLTPDPQNPRKRTERGSGMLSRSLREVGAGRSIVIDEEGQILAGNGTIEAAAEVGIENVKVVDVDGNTIVAVRRSGLTEEQKVKLALYDNRTADLATYDAEILLEIDQTIDLSPFFTDIELNELSLNIEDEEEGDRPKNNYNKDADSIPEESNIPKRVKRGELWEIAGHQLLCGDCRNPDDVKFLIGDRPVNLVMTSPPYASQRKYDEDSGFKPIHPDEYVEWFEFVQSNIKKHLAKDGSFFLNIKEHMEEGERHIYVLELLLSLRKHWGWSHIDTFAWTHQGFPISVKIRFKNQWEPIFHLGHTHKIKPINFEAVGLEVSDSHMKSVQRYKEGYREPHRNSGFADATNKGTMMKEYEYTRPGNVLSINNGAVGEEYRIQSAAYPVALPEFFIKAFSDEGDRCFDPFMGSGTTMVAAHKNNRIGLGTEISEKYCDLILARMEELTGDKAVLVNSL